MTRQRNEFEVLGVKISYLPEQGNAEEAEKIVDLVLDEITNIKKSKPTIKDMETVILVALKLAKERVELEKDCKHLLLRCEADIEATIGHLGKA